MAYYNPAPAEVPDFRIPMPADADSISSIEFSPVGSFLAAGGWDSKVRIWELTRAATGGVAAATAKSEMVFGGPVLDISWQNSGAQLFVAGCDNTVQLWDLATNTKREVARHALPVRHVFWLPEANLLCTGSWDKTIQYWDVRTPGKAAASATLAERVYGMDVKHPVAVVAMAAVPLADGRSTQRPVSIFDLKAPHAPFRNMASPLKYQSRCVRIWSTKDGFAVGSIEGRCAIRWIDQAKDTTGRAFAFKCHRGGAKNTEIYAVNAVDFHPNPGYPHAFATAGADGSFTFWDKGNKSRLKEFKPNATGVTTSISAAKWNPSGDWYCYAASYDWSKGGEHFRAGDLNAMFVHYTTDKDIKPRRVQQ